MILANVSDAAVGHAAEVLKAPQAQGQAPELYLLLLFAGIVLVGILVLMLRYAKGTQQTFLEYVNSQSEKEEKRFEAFQRMTEDNNAFNQKNLETVVACATRCEATLRDIDRWRDRSIGSA
jgi:hypothetical protein